MGIILGVDIGGSTTKIVGLNGGGQVIGHLMVKAGDPLTSAYGAVGRFLSERGLGLGDVAKIMLTGVGANHIPGSMHNHTTEKVDEFLAIGLGGVRLSGIEKSIVVSMGTGTAFVSVDGDKIYHFGGTGVGGGTLIGLCDRLFGIRTTEHLTKLAEQGDLSQVDLSIGDISGTTLSYMAMDTTAANFGKVSDMATNADLALGVYNMVYQAVGMLAAFAARSVGTKDIVITGNLSTIDIGRKILDQIGKLVSVNLIIPDKADFATAIGAAIYGTREVKR